MRGEKFETRNVPVFWLTLKPGGTNRGDSRPCKGFECKGQLVSSLSRKDTKKTDAVCVWRTCEVLVEVRVKWNLFYGWTLYGMWKPLVAADVLGVQRSGEGRQAMQRKWCLRDLDVAKT